MIESNLIAVTPCKNEEKNLPNLIQSMIAQNKKPIFWVIVDDGSTDNTGEIIDEAEKKYDWIKGIRLGEHKEYMGAHLSAVCNAGFEFAINLLNKKGLSYDYIALIDADNILESRYFERLVKEFEEYPKLGLASGNSAFADIENILNDLRLKYSNITVMSPEFWQMWDSSLEIQKSRDDLPMGSARIWRKECFEETGGYLPVPLPDSVSNVKAKLKGWKTRRFMDIRVIERRGLSKQGLWKGYKQKGESYFFLDYPLPYAILKSIKYSFKKPYYTGAAFIYGFISSLAWRKEKVDDYEIRRYYREIYPKEVKYYYKLNIKQIFRI